MIAITKFLKDNWIYIAALALLAAQSVAIEIITNQRDAARANAASLTLQLGSANASIERQNAAVESLRQQREEDRELYLAGLRAAERKAITLEIGAAELLALPAPEGDQCAPAAALLMENLR